MPFPKERADTVLSLSSAETTDEQLVDDSEVTGPLVAVFQGWLKHLEVLSNFEESLTHLDD